MWCCQQRIYGTGLLTNPTYREKGLGFRVCRPSPNPTHILEETIHVCAYDIEKKGSHPIILFG